MAVSEFLVKGRALIGERLDEAPVTISVRDGIIHRVEPMSGSADMIPWICPAFFNAHTHLGDILYAGGGQLIYRKGIRKKAEGTKIQ